MDWNKLQRKLFEMDPVDPREDLRKLAESARPNVEVGSSVDYIIESIDVQKGSLGLDKDYSIADFAALAGITLTESQKKGSAGQAKGKDPMPKAEPGRTKHPLKDKLVGEGFKDGWDNNTSLNLFKKMTGVDNKEPARARSPGAKTSSAKVSGNDWKSFLKQHTVQLQQIAANPKKKKEFDNFMAKMAESVQEAPKSRPIKARDPSSQYMNDLRKSGAMGAHKDKKRDAKIGKEKHKKDYTTESIKQMLYRKLNESK